MTEWTPLGSVARYTRGRLTLREDSWRLPDGREMVYPVLAVGVTVGVLPFVDAGQVLLVRQYRHLPREASWELPGGGAVAGEDPLEAAQRELREEGGYRAGRLSFLTRFWPSNAYLDEIAYCYAAHDLVADPLPADDDEFFERRVVPCGGGGPDGPRRRDRGVGLEGDHPAVRRARSTGHIARPRTRDLRPAPGR